MRKLTLDEAIVKATDKYMTLQTEDAHIENGNGYVAVIPSNFLLSNPRYYTQGFINRMRNVAKFLSKYTDKKVYYGQGYLYRG